MSFPNCSKLGAKFLYLLIFLLSISINSRSDYKKILRPRNEIWLIFSFYLITFESLVILSSKL